MVMALLLCSIPNQNHFKLLSCAIQKLNGIQQEESKHIQANKTYLKIKWFFINKLTACLNLHMRVKADNPVSVCVSVCLSGRFLNVFLLFNITKW